MDKTTVLKKIAPEIVPLVERRYIILRNIYFAQPIGRRGLAARLDLRERAVRSDVDHLRDQGLVVSDALGMRTTPEGEAVLLELNGLLREFRGLNEIETILADRLQLKKVVIVPGDSDEDETVKKEMARATAKYLGEILRDGDVLAVTGGTTLSEVARSLPLFTSKKDVTVVPARGGLGEDVEIQANTVAATIARQLGGTYRLLHVPDDIREEAIMAINNEPKIKAMLDVIKGANVVLHGIGTAEEMARRRGLRKDQLAILREKNAVGEAFGYYFDRHGNIVFSTSSAGLRLEDLENVGIVIAVGGGRSKAEAALAVMSNKYQDVCITDEGCAREMGYLLGLGDTFPGVEPELDDFNGNNGNNGIIGNP